MSYTSSLDTPPALQQKLSKEIQKLTPAQKLEKICSLSDFGRSFKLEHLKQKHPHASTLELRKELVRDLYGEELYRLIS